jgi:uncharacterized protein with ATP-grasp and redox domains
MMPTDPRCLPCFLEQTLRAAGVMGLGEEETAALAAGAAGVIAGVDFSASPPKNSEPLYRFIAEKTGRPDPFAEVKRRSNREAMARAAGVAEEIRRNSGDPLAAAMGAAIRGNLMDYGARGPADPHPETPPGIDQRREIADRLRGADKVLYLADNAGELAYDRVLIEMIPAEVTVAVKSGPIINDATVEDARACGIGQVARVIENGAAIPGTVLRRCSPEFLRAFAEADLVISKGQGNFETLAGERTGKTVCHLFMVKCPLVEDQLHRLSGRRVSLGAEVAWMESQPQEKETNPLLAFNE